MRRSLTVIAAGVTAFAVVLLASVVYAYRAMASERAASADVSAAISAEAPVLGSSVAASISARDAADLAGRYIQRSDPYSVELAERFGASVYMVTFSSGDVVYVSRLGALLATVPPPNTYMTSWSGGGGGGGGGSLHSSEWDDDDEHEEHEEDEDHEEEEHHESEDTESP